jgi:hypothetical protein
MRRRAGLSNLLGARAGAVSSCHAFSKVRYTIRRGMIIYMEK